MTLPLAPFLAARAVLAMDIASPGLKVFDTIASAMGSGRQAGLAFAAGAAPAISAAVGIFFAGIALGRASGLAG